VDLGVPAESPEADPPIQLRVLGTFKGGGAKGIAYVGALRAARSRGIWFDAVAGSSAGAITAALIAAGLSPSDLARVAPKALSEVKSRLLPGVFSRNGAWFDTEALASWLERHLQQRVRGEFDSRSPAVTFAELRDARFDIDLYVVAMDLHRRQPIVFHHVTTPNAGIADAVVASCAIPLMMPPGRVAIASSAGVEVHRLVDGGTWANYPTFVFKDPSFRSFYGLGELADNATTLGFVLGDERVGSNLSSVVSLERRRSVFDLGHVSSNPLLRSLLTWRSLRWVTTLIVPVISTTIILFWIGRSANRGYPMFEGVHESVRGAAIIVASATAFASWLLAFAAAIAQIRLAREALEVGVPSLAAALSVGTGVPDWIGAHSSDAVVRLSLHPTIRTTSFKITSKVVDEVIDAAEGQAAGQLNLLFPHLKAMAGARPALSEGADVTMAATESVRGERPVHRTGQGALRELLTMAGLALLTVFALIASVAWHTADNPFDLLAGGLIFTLLFTFLLFALLHERPAYNVLDPVLVRPLLPRFVSGLLFVSLSLLWLDAFSITDLQEDGLDIADVVDACMGLGLFLVGIGGVLSALARLRYRQALRARERELRGTLPWVS
jgi:Patatin-like phospholipase